jgi:hypothetical protein
MPDLGWALKAFESLQPPKNPLEISVQSAPVLFGTSFVKVARDYSGRPKLLIPSSSQEPFSESQMRLTSGLSISQSNFPDAAGLPVHYLVLSSQRNDVDDLFSLLAQDICEHLSEKDDFSLVNLVHERIAEWQGLLSRFTNGEPSPNAQLGLLGELLVLRELEQSMGSDALQCWFGSGGSRHDFEASTWALEVKSSLMLSRRIARVHGLNQLNATNGSTLRLIHLQFERALGGASIESVVRELETKFTLTLFEERLSPFFPDGLSDLPSWASRLEVNLFGFSLHSVNEDFPKITSDLLGPHAKRFSRLEYDIDLEGLDCVIDNSGSLASLGATSW